MIKRNAKKSSQARNQEVVAKSGLESLIWLRQKEIWYYWWVHIWSFIKRDTVAHESWLLKEIWVYDQIFTHFS